MVHVLYAVVSPKKILVEATKTIDSNKRHQDKGISDTDRVRMKWDKVINLILLNLSWRGEREADYIKPKLFPSWKSQVY
jgi:hypothetical protein